MKITKRNVLIFLAVFVFITVLRLSWMQMLTMLDVNDQPEAKAGVLDLRDKALPSKQTFRLDGEWGFYANEHLVEEDRLAMQSIQVPGTWQDEVDDISSEGQPLYTGSYRLKVLLAEDEEAVSMRMTDIRNAYAVYVNGELIKQVGKPTLDSATYLAKRMPATVELPTDKGEIDLLIHVADHESMGGIIKTIRFGKVDAIQTRVSLSIGLQLLLVAVFLIHFIYSLILYVMSKKMKPLLYYGLINLFAILTVITVDDRLLFMLLQVDFFWEKKIILLSYGLAVSLTFLLNYTLFPKYLPAKMIKFFYGFILLFVVFVLVSPTTWMTMTMVLLPIMMILPCIMSLYILVKIIQEREDVTYLLLGVAILFVNVIWSIIIQEFSTEYMHYPFDLIFSLIAFSAFWFEKFFKRTEQAEDLADKLQEEHKKKDEFLLNTSHELRNPLHGMMNLTQVILDDKEHPIDAVQVKRVSTLSQLNRYLSQLVEDLLDVTRLKEQTVHLQAKAFSLVAVAEGIREMMLFYIEDKPLKLVIDLPKDFPLLWGDDRRFFQILFNLLHNAVKFTNEGTITIRGRVDGLYATIEVEDTGIGIPPDAMGLIFEAYEQGSHDERILNNGIGIGLYICKYLVRLHDGKMDVHSEQNVGTTFSFTFPIVNEENLSDSIPIYPDEISEESQKDLDAFNEVAATSNSLISYKQSAENLIDLQDIKGEQASILIVDDEPINSTIIKQLLETNGFQTTVAYDAIDALSILATNSFDIVITDVMMPRLSGFELTRKIRERYSQVELPILLLTARTRLDDIALGFQVGANDYITKPVDAIELLARIKSLIRLKLAHDEHLKIEGAWLQSQIQPHFIFNTLNSLAALALFDFDRMQKLLDIFSSYLRLSFDFRNTDPTIPLEKELELVRLYTYIEQERFGERLKVVYEIDVQEFALPPLSIQPLVENALKHGIFNKAEGGLVTIAIHEEETAYVVSVSDDGVGMNEEQLATLRRNIKIRNRSSTSSSVGLRNINLRLKRLYDQQLKIESQLNEGTTVSFHIPKKSVE